MSLDLLQKSACVLPGEKEIDEKRDAETLEMRAVFQKYSLSGDPLEAATTAITSNCTTWVDFMMQEELGLEEPNPKRALRSALTIGLAYIAGGIIPLTPYALNLTLSRALMPVNSPRIRATPTITSP